VAITTTNLNWRDQSRRRDVPLKIYTPEKIGLPVPLIVFSHGLGGSREGYAYLGQHWARHGYIVAHVQHAGSDASIFQFGEDLLDSARRAVLDPNIWRERPSDVSFVIDRMATDPRVNTNAIGVAGHSFGADTTLAIIGERIVGESFKDRRVKAAVAMSSSRPLSPQAVSDVKTPCMHITGTQDDSPIFPTKPKDRRYVFEHVSAMNQWLVTLRGAHHFTFSDNSRWGGKLVVRDPRHQPWVCHITMKFWDAFLKADSEAAVWIQGRGLMNFFGDDATVEQK
jgi:predicted dienelactone hydrolase